MRAFAFASLVLLLPVVALGGCIDRDQARVQGFTPGPNRNFVFSVGTNTVMTANDDGAAEQIRRDWLAQTLGAAGLCHGGYVIYQRRLVVPPERPALVPPPTQADFGNTGSVVYSGACL